MAISYAVTEEMCSMRENHKLKAEKLRFYKVSMRSFD